MLQVKAENVTAQRKKITPKYGHFNPKLGHCILYRARIGRVPATYVTGSDKRVNFAHFMNFHF